MGLKLAGARLLLKGGLLNRTNYLSAYRSAAVEFSDTWYKRQAINLAGWTRSNDGLAENTNAVEFPSPTADAAAAPSHWGLHTAVNGGSLLLTVPLADNPGAPALGATFGFDAGAAELALQAGAVTGRGLRKAYESGIVSGTTYLGLFEAQPSTGGKAVDTREAIAAARWTEDASVQNSVRNNQNIDFGLQVTDVEQPMWVGLYDAAQAGNLLWEDEIDVTPPDPKPGARITVVANAIRVGFVIDA